MRIEMSGENRLAVPFLLFLGTLAALWLIPRSSGPAVFLLSAAAAGGAGLFAMRLLRLGRATRGAWASAVGKAALAVVAVLAGLALFEAVLHVQQRLLPPPAQPATGKGRRAYLAMPEEWNWRQEKVAGARSAFRWQGVLHVFDENMMRRTSPFPPKRAGTLRIMVVGDSLTYGKGVAEDLTYPRLLERELGEGFDVEVLNLGVCALQSGEILEIVRKFAPLLAPDLIVYGVCLNDFLPSEVAEYRNNQAFRFPLPESLKRFLTARTLAGGFFVERYDRLLMRLKLRDDFMSDILKNFRSYQTRFLADLEAMNRIARERGLPPVVAGVVHQNLAPDSRDYRVAMIAERLIREAGMTLVPAGDYFRRYAGRALAVSRWEGHPNEEAHRIFADNFRAVLERLPPLQAHRKVPGPPP